MADDAKRRRYPGVRAFEEADVALFYGRQAAAEQLLLRVLSVRLLLQFAPSGVGKTSLLQAGLFPKLRGHDCFPFIVRLNRQDESLVAAVRRSLLEAAAKSGLRDPVVPAAAEDLPSLLAGTQLWSDEPALLTPVLAFDQFEEVFTLRDETFRSGFARDIGAVVAARPGADAAAPPVKVIISLREEFLGRLEQFSREIPELFAERLRLPPLNRGEARAAIVEPAALQEGRWLSPPFGYTPACVEALLDFIDGTSERSPLVEPLTLQLVCSHAEDLVLASHRDNRPLPSLTLDDFRGTDGLRRLVAGHYRRELDRLPRTQRRRAREMVERGLLDPAGKRLMLEEGEIERDHRVTRASLDELVSGHLLRREPRNDSLFYEIGHDRLAEAIAKQRRIRVPTWVKRTLGGAALAFAILIVIGISVGTEQLRTMEALQKAERTLGVMLADNVVARLRDVGEGEALQAAIRLIDTGDAATEVPNEVLLARLEGDIARERGRGDAARKHFERALTLLGPEPTAESAASEPSSRRAERARLLGRLAVIDADSGELVRSRSRHEAGAAAWTALLQGSPSLQERLDATEMLSYLSELALRQFDGAAAEARINQALDTALGAWLQASGRGGDADQDLRFEQARALVLLADVLLMRSRLWGEPEIGRAAHALAQEAWKLRPQSADTVSKLVVTSAQVGSQSPGPPQPEPPEALLLSTKQLDYLVRRDPADLMARRNRAALTLLLAQQQARCLADAACGRRLTAERRTRMLEDLQVAIGDLRWLASDAPSNLSLLADIGWALSMQAELQHAAGEREAAAQTLGRAIKAYEAVGGADPDPERIATIASKLLLRAEWLARLGRTAEVPALLDQAHQLETSLSRQPGFAGWVVRNILIDRARVMQALGRGSDERALREQADEIEQRLGQPWRDAKKRAQEANERGVAALDRIGTETPTPTLPQARAAAAAFARALVAYPAEAVYWDNLRAAHQRIAELQQGQAEPQAQREQLGAAAAALGASTVAIALADGAQQREERYRLHHYVARRELALVLRDRGFIARADALTRDGMADSRDAALAGGAEAAERLIQLRDAYYMQALMRFESRHDGWEELGLLAAALAERVAQREPGNPHHAAWLGEAHLEQGYRLRATDRAQEAATEFAAAARSCRRGLDLRPDDKTLTRLQECIAEAEAGGR